MIDSLADLLNKMDVETVLGGGVGSFAPPESWRITNLNKLVTGARQGPVAAQQPHIALRHSGIVALADPLQIGLPIYAIVSSESASILTQLRVFDDSDGNTLANGPAGKFMDRTVLDQGSASTPGGASIVVATQSTAGAFGGYIADVSGLPAAVRVDLRGYILGAGKGTRTREGVGFVANTLNVGLSVTFVYYEATLRRVDA